MYLMRAKRKNDQSEEVSDRFLGSSIDNLNNGIINLKQHTHVVVNKNHQPTVKL